MAEVSMYQKPGLTPGFPSESDGETTRVLGTTGYSDVDTFVVALEWYTPTTLPAFADLGLWELTGDDPNANTGTRLELLTFTVGSMTTGAWNRANLPSPRAWAANKPFLAQIHTDGHYVFSNPTTFPFASSDGTLHAYDEATGGNGRWANGAPNTQVATNNHPGGSGYNFFVNVITDVDAGGISAEVGQVTETGTVFPITDVVSATIGQVVETGTVFSITKAKAKTVAQVTETGSVFSVTKAKAKTLGQVQEAGTAFSVTNGTTISREIGQVVEMASVGRLGPTPEVDTEIFITPGYTIINL